MTDTLKIITDFINAFFEQPPRIMIVMALVLFGYGWKKSAWNDRWIPFVLPAIGMVLFPLFLCHHLATMGRCMVEGFVGGNIAVWLNQAYRQLFVSQGEDKSLMHNATRFLRRSDVPGPPPPAPKAIKPDGIEPPTKP